MATYYVNSGASGANDGSSWTDAYTTLGAAVTAASSTSDVIKVHVGHAETLAANATYNIKAAQIICVDKDNSDAYSEQDGTTQYISGTNYNIQLLGASSTNVTCFVYGLAFVVAGTSGLMVAGSANQSATFTFNKCKLWLTTTNTSGYIASGSSTASNESINKFFECNLKFGATEQYILPRAVIEFYDCSINSSGSAPSSLMKVGGKDSTVFFVACDLSHITGTLFGDLSGGIVTGYLYQCKLGAAVTIVGSQTVPTESVRVFMADCASGDTHYAFGYYSQLGSLDVDTSIYANDGAEYDSTGSKYSWKIVGAAAATPEFPFMTPWISVYNETTSALSPSLECVRSGSATAYDNDEVWSEWCVKTTGGSTQATFDQTDRMAFGGSPAAQSTGALSASGWTGEGGTSWFGKLAPASSITPAEIGDIIVRVCVAGANTVYVDPQIRGLS